MLTKGLADQRKALSGRRKALLVERSPSHQADRDPLRPTIVLSQVGVALACIGVALFAVGVARATPKSI